jgi:hypothetical protein
MVTEYFDEGVPVKEFLFRFKCGFVMLFDGHEKVFPKLFAVTQVNVKEMFVVIMRKRRQVVLFGQSENIGAIPRAFMLIGKNDKFSCIWLQGYDQPFFIFPFMDTRIQFTERGINPLFVGSGRKAVSQADNRRCQ